MYTFLVPTRTLKSDDDLNVFRIYKYTVHQRAITEQVLQVLCLIMIYGTKNVIVRSIPTFRNPHFSLGITTQKQQLKLATEAAYNGCIPFRMYFLSPTATFFWIYKKHFRLYIVSILNARLINIQIDDYFKMAIYFCQYLPCSAWLIVGKPISTVDILFKFEGHPVGLISKTKVHGRRI